MENVKRYKYKSDIKDHIYENESVKVVNHSSGYSFTLPTNSLEYDYSFSELRCKYFFDDCVLTTSFEDKNPYPDRDKDDPKRGWEIYLDEWIIRYISNEEFLQVNNISKIKETVHSYEFLKDYELVNFTYFINDCKNYDYPYYNIAIIRKLDNYKEFYLFVMKSKSDRNDMFYSIINSFELVERKGKTHNVEEKYPLCENSKWNKMTKRYFKKLVNQNSVDWGMFIKSLTSRKDGSYKYIKDYYKDNGLRLDNLTEHDFELLPTYMHISWGDKFNYFPSTLVNKLAKGNGFNGKKVLHFTFQYTANNNTSMFGYSPTFDILRGKFDEYFRQLARDIKKYHYPVLFRLNNEMNTDWTSYSGIVSLLDPDIFITTWNYLYNIFEEEGVDNCIWIFNPIHITTPYCNWGEYLNYYPKGKVNILGLTSYERGNEKKYQTFRKMYKALYKKNTPYFENFPYVISEFGAGAGGKVLFNYEKCVFEEKEIRRNLNKQSKWVKNMFKEFAKQEDYVKNIKGAIWFSVNDYAYVNGKNEIMNYFELDDSVMPTIRQLKKGLQK